MAHKLIKTRSVATVEFKLSGNPKINSFTAEVDGEDFPEFILEWWARDAPEYIAEVMMLKDTPPGCPRNVKIGDTEIKVRWDKVPA